MMPLLAFVALLLVLGFLFWWLIIETEGVYLGRRMVVLLYDLYASRYDRVKQFDEYADMMLICQPIMARVQPQADPLMLDVATGAGRLPLIMARNGGFSGHVIGLDASRRMLNIARRKVAAQRFEGYITLMRHDAGKGLPFDADAFRCRDLSGGAGIPARPAGRPIRDVSRPAPRRRPADNHPHRHALDAKSRLERRRRCGASWRRWTCATFTSQSGRKITVRSGRAEQARASPLALAHWIKSGACLIKHAITLSQAGLLESEAAYPASCRGDC